MQEQSDLETLKQLLDRFKVTYIEEPLDPRYTEEEGISVRLDNSHDNVFANGDCGVEFWFTPSGIFGSVQVDG